MKQRGTVSGGFDAVASEIAEIRTRPEIAVRATPGPTKLAPYALALNATVSIAEQDVADGRLVILHDPAGQDSWHGTWRIVLFASSELDEATAADPVLTDMGWTWLQEALGERDLAVRAFGGTVTRTSSQSFGALADRPATGELEIRASWTPVIDAPHPHLPTQSVPVIIREHVEAWLALLALITSMEPYVEGVARLDPRR